MFIFNNSTIYLCAFFIKSIRSVLLPVYHIDTPFHDGCLLGKHGYMLIIRHPFLILATASHQNPYFLKKLPTNGSSNSIIIYSLASIPRLRILSPYFLTMSGPSENPTVLIETFPPFCIYVIKAIFRDL